MYDVFTRVVNKAQSRGDFVSVDELDALSVFIREYSKRLDIVNRLSSNSSRIVSDAARVLFIEQPQLIAPGGNAYTHRRMAACLRDIEIILRYVTYAMFIGDRSILEDRCLNGLREIYIALGTPINAVAQAIQYLKVIAIKIVNDPNGITFGDCSTLVAELASYFDLASAAVADVDFSPRSIKLEAEVNLLRDTMIKHYYIRGRRYEIEQLDGVAAIHFPSDTRSAIPYSLGAEKLKVNSEELKLFNEAGWIFIDSSLLSQRTEESAIIPENASISGAVFRDPEDGTILIGTNSITVKLKPELSPQEASAKLKKQKLTIARQLKFAPNLFEVRIPDQEDLLNVANRLYEDEDVIYAEPEMLEHISQRFTPTDPDYLKQWQWKNNGANNCQLNGDIKAEAAWEHVRGANMRVAVIDNGFDVEHEDLKDGILAESGYFQPNKTFVQELVNYPNGDHGTFCAGMAAARANNGHGGCGIAFECGLLLIACLPDQVTSQQTLADAIAYAVDPATAIDNADPSSGADVISCSLGHNQHKKWIMRDTLEQAINFAATQGRKGLGTPIFWATSNLNIPIALDEIVCHPQVIAVGRSNCQDLADGSAFGSELACLAPGKDVYSTLSGNQYGTNTGTSFAAPCVAGLAALVLSIVPSLTRDEVRQLLLDTCDKVGGVDYNNGHNHHYGFGRINAKKAVEKAFMLAAIAEAQKGLREGGIPIGSVLVKGDQIIGRGYHRRIQTGNPILSADIDCLQNAGTINPYEETVMYSTLMPCYLGAGALVQLGIKKVVVGESKNFSEAQQFLQNQGIEIVDLDLEECKQLVKTFIDNHPILWHQNISRTP